MEENNTVIQQNVPSPASILTFGILSLALCESVIFGLIFGFIARSKTKAFERVNTEVPGQARTGNILALIGIICSFVMVAICILYFALVVGIASSMR